MASDTRQLRHCRRSLASPPRGFAPVILAIDAENMMCCKIPNMLEPCGINPLVLRHGNHPRLHSKPTFRGT
jgi:hypothetical protein